jgi:hypothetical protein
MDRQLPADTLNEIGVLKRREIEARILLPVLEALGAEFGRERVLGVARDVIVAIAREQGRDLGRRVGGDSLTHFAGALEDWKKGDAYRMDVLEQDPRAGLVQRDALPVRRDVPRARSGRCRRAPFLQPRFLPGGGLQSRHPADAEPDHHGGRFTLRLPFRARPRAGRVRAGRPGELTVRVVAIRAHGGLDQLRYIWRREVNIVGCNGWTRSDLEQLLEEVARGSILPIIDRVYPLEEAAHAMRMLEDRDVFGKVLVRP